VKAGVDLANWAALNVSAFRAVAGHSHHCGSRAYCDLVWWASSDGTQEGRRDRQGGGQAITVVTALATPREFVDAIDAVGTAKANESVVLTAKITDTVSALNFTDGQKVATGTVIAEMTSGEQSADIAAERASLSEAQKQFERISGLSARGNATRAQLDAAVAARDSATARVRALEARLSDRLIKTPFAGVLGLRQVSVGTLVRPGDVITTLDDISIIKLDFTVPETFMSALAAGMTVKAKAAAYPGRTFEGKVAAIDTRVDPLTRAVSVRAELPNPDDRLKPGMLLSVSLLNNQRSSLSVPESALVPVQDKKFVFIVSQEEKAERREVTIGARVPGFVEIKSGLEEGERVIVEGLLRVRPGISVQVQPPEAAADESSSPRT
jgi:membrane fusion protein (multidrug efflux system)